MKKGSSGDDVLGLDIDSDKDKAESEADESDSSESLNDPDPEDTTTTVSDEEHALDPPQTGADESGIPWVYTRDNVKEDRDMVQFYLRQFVQEAEDDFVSTVGEELGTDVSKTDVREAAYVAAMRDPEIVADELERWGFQS